MVSSDELRKGKRPGAARPLLALAFCGTVALSYLAFTALFTRGAGGTTSGGGRKALEQQDAEDGAAAEVKSKAQQILESRVCGSPAVDGYAHVKPECLEDSPTNKWWQENKPQPDDLDIHIERHADYDGLAVAWGIGNTKANVEECAEACRQHKPAGPTGGPFGSLPCNAFAYCAHDTCFEPDAHKHKRGDCWLKFTEGPASPEVNMRGRLSMAMQLRHPQAPKEVQWHSGVLLPHGIRLTNGSWSPRHEW